MIKKEIDEGIRSYKFMIIAFVFIFFALLDPVMLKFLPDILKLQTGMEGLAEFITISGEEAIKSYIGNILQIIPVVLAFTLSGVVSKEFTNHYIDIPLSKGIDLGRLFTSKFIVYGSVIVMIAFISLLVNYYYSMMIFGEKEVYIVSIIKVALMVSLMLIYYLSTHMLVELLIEKAYLSSIISVGIYFGQYGIIHMISKQYRYLMPHYLALEVNRLYNSFRYEDIICSLITILISLLFVFMGRIIIDNKSVY